MAWACSFDREDKTCIKKFRNLLGSGRLEGGHGRITLRLILGKFLLRKGLAQNRVQWGALLSLVLHLRILHFIFRVLDSRRDDSSF